MAVVQTIMSNLVAVLSILINLEVADLDESLILTSIDTADACGCSCIGVLGTYIKEAILAARSFRYVYGIFITFLLLIRIIYA